MIGSLFAISGMLAAGAGAGPPSRPAALTVEIEFATHTGEGSQSVKFITRDGCYQAESVGSAGGGPGSIHVSWTGCHRPSQVAALFERLDRIGPGGLIRSGSARAGGADAASTQDPVDSTTLVTLIGPDGARWITADRATEDDLLHAINNLPSDNQWYAAPPDKPAGKGPQLVVLSVNSSRGIYPHFAAMLATDGRWWCERSMIYEHIGDASRRRKKALSLGDAPARVGRILAGARQSAPASERPIAQPASAGSHPAFRGSVEVAWPDQPRGPLFPSSLRDTVVTRFAAEMRALTEVCDIR